MIHIENVKSLSRIKMHRSEKQRERKMPEHLQRCHVIEGMVQLLTNGLVLQLLSIQFIWRSEVDRKYRQVSGTAATQASRKAGRKRETNGGKEQREEKTKKKLGQTF